MRRSAPSGCLALLVLLALLFFPLFLADVILAALGKLGLTPTTAILAALGIFLGGLVNIPVTRVEREVLMEVPPMLFGLDRLMPRRVVRRQYTVIAVNVGGCLVPVSIAIYELIRIAGVGSTALLLAILAIAINVAVCYWLARPVPNVGIALPSLVPALVAAVCGLLFLSGLAAPLAFAAGVLGPLIGADLLHLRDVYRISTGVASIGGAGTFDGIVISGLIATLLA
jgi:uncharacterized membrane protein